MHRKSMESLGQLTRLGQVWRVIRVEFNDLGARVLGDHPLLQRERNSSIASTYHVIPIHVLESSERDGYRRHERRDWRGRCRAMAHVATSSVQEPYNA